MFENKDLTRIALIAGGALLLSAVATKLNDNRLHHDKNSDYEMIKKYVLNDSPLYGHNRPKLWIHSKYEINSRNWNSFGSRNNANLNQPYLHMTIKSILDYNSEDFNICLIDDDSFRKLIPSWDIDLVNMADPMRSQFRELGMLMCIYYYGGMTIPNSFLCMRNLKPLYDKYTANDKFFATENINRINNMVMDTNKYPVVPDTFISGANKNTDHLLLLITKLQEKLKSGHISEEREFKGFVSSWCIQQSKIGMVNVVDGKEVGIKTVKNKPIVIDDLMEESYLDIGKYVYGIYIPSNEMLKRTKYNWFAVMSEEEILNSRLALAKYFKISDIDVSTKESKSTVTVVSI